MPPDPSISHVIISQKSNSNINTILQLLNSGVKKNSQLLQDLLSKVNYSNTKSPLKKYPKDLPHMHWLHKHMPSDLLEYLCGAG